MRNIDFFWGLSSFLLTLLVPSIARAQVDVTRAESAFDRATLYNEELVGRVDVRTSSGLREFSEGLVSEAKNPDAARNFYREARRLSELLVTEVMPTERFRDLVCRPVLSAFWVKSCKTPLASVRCESTPKYFSTEEGISYFDLSPIGTQRQSNPPTNLNFKSKADVEFLAKLEKLYTNRSLLREFLSNIYLRVWLFAVSNDREVPSIVDSEFMVKKSVMDAFVNLELGERYGYQIVEKDVAVLRPNGKPIIIFSDPDNQDFRNQFLESDFDYPLFPSDTVYDPDRTAAVLFGTFNDQLLRFFNFNKVPLDSSPFGDSFGRYSFPLILLYIIENSRAPQVYTYNWYRELLSVGGNRAVMSNQGCSSGNSRWLFWSDMLVFKGDEPVRSSAYWKPFVSYQD